MEEEVNGDWEYELVMVEFCKNFILKCIIVMFLSFGVDDFLFVSLGLGGEKNSLEEFKIV